MKKSEMQTVVDYVNVQSDYLYEFIRDKTVNDEDRVHFKNELANLCKFMQEAKDKGFDVANACYPLDNKLKEVQDGSRC